MKKQSLVLISLALSLASAVFAHRSEEGLEVAETIINLSKSIVNDISPPPVGAERIVTDATITDEGTTRIYNIEGKDVSHSGRVYSTYWIRLRKQISATDTIIPVARPVRQDTQKIIEALLNSLYDIADMDLDHRRIVLDSVTEVSADPLTFELIGENRVCRHVEQNTFKITITRHIERNRPFYETQLLMPYSLGDNTDGNDEEVVEENHDETNHEGHDDMNV